MFCQGSACLKSGLCVFCLVFVEDLRFRVGFNGNTVWFIRFDYIDVVVVVSNINP